MEDYFLLSLSKYKSNKVRQEKFKENTVKKKSLCVFCKGGRMLCGKTRCPVIVKSQSMIKHSKMNNSCQIQGSSPPAIFVGRIGYPKVHIGPMIPSYFGNTEILDTPELWIGKSIDDIIDYRQSLVRGKTISNINEASKGGKIVETLQELAMANSSIDSEAKFYKKPQGRLIFSNHSQPFGPSAPLKNLEISSVKVDRSIEKAFYDRDLKASDAILNLYLNDVLITRIQRSFSIGMFGQGTKRKFVPTRWSITAVDSTISLSLIDKIKENETIDEYYVYIFNNMGNIFVAILMPEKWSFEWIEAWFPNTLWNINGQKPALIGDYEGYYGRNSYARVGGCYYSARLAVAEKLLQTRRQASVLVFREILPEYILPVGVWNVRESMRKALETKPYLFSTLQESLNFAKRHLNIPMNNWIKNSEMLKEVLFQRKITDFCIRSLR